MDTTKRDAAVDKREANTSAVRQAGNTVWVLRAKDANAEPFNFVGVPPAIVVVAADEKAARTHAASSHPAMVPAGFGIREGKRVAVEAHSPWQDADLTSCEEPDLSTPGVVARDMGA